MSLYNNVNAGFIFDFTGNKVVDPCYIIPFSKRKFIAPNVFSKNGDIFKTNNIMIFDMEPDKATVSNIDNAPPSHIFVPNIKEFSYIHIPGKLDPTVSIETYKQKTYYTDKSYSHTINFFCETYLSLGCPTLVSHNGNRFDFLILLACIHRYVPDPINILTQMKSFDSWIMVRNHKIIEKSNVGLFQRTIDKYPTYQDLIYLQHHSLPDCKMLLLWLTHWQH